MKVFISQPMAGRSEEEIVCERKHVKKHIKTYYKGVEFIDSVITDDSKSPVEMIAESIRMLSDADFIYMCRNWEYYRGCRIEYIVAKEYNIPVIVWNSTDTLFKKYLEMFEKRIRKYNRRD